MVIHYFIEYNSLSLPISSFSDSLSNYSKFNYEYYDTQLRYAIVHVSCIYDIYMCVCVISFSKLPVTELY